MRALFDLAKRMSRLEKRLATIIQIGVVSELNPIKGTVRLKMGEDDRLSAHVRYAQLAGDYSAHIPPTVGQQMMLVSPGGDMRVPSLAIPYSWNTAFPNPGDSAEENIVTFGNVTLRVKDSRVQTQVGDLLVTVTDSIAKFEIGDMTATISDGGLAVVGGGAEIAETLQVGGDSTLDGALTVNGGSVTHDGKDIGKTHKHSHGDPTTGVPK